MPPINKTIWLKSAANQHYRRTNNPLRAVVQSPSTWEQYSVVNAGVGAIALKSLRNNKYVSASDTAGHPLYAATDQTGSWEKFNWIDFGNGKIALYSPQWNTYVSIDPGDQTASVKASSTTTSPDTWEFFYWGEA